MKVKSTLAVAVLLACSAALSFAQDSEPQMLMIHEDLVIPAQGQKYMDTAMEMKKALEDNNVATFGFNAFWLTDNTWWFIRPISSYAALDDPPMQELFDKMGEEKAMELFSKYNGTYHQHRNFVAVFHPSLSYKPEELQEPGNNYREWMYLYYDDKDQEAMMAVMKEWKALYEQKGVDLGYTIYSAGFGHYGPVLVVHTWAKNEADMARKSEEAQTKLGEERMELLGKTMPYIQKQESKRGWFMEEYSYMPQQ